MLNSLRNNAGLLSGIVVCLSAALFLAACSPTTSSPTTPGKTVDAIGLAAEVSTAQATFDKRAAELTADVESFNEKAKLSGDVLAAKAAFRAKVVNVAGGLLPQLLAGQVTPAGGLAALFTLVSAGAGIGAAADSRKKQVVINGLRASAPDTAAATSSTSSTSSAAPLIPAELLKAA